MWLLDLTGQWLACLVCSYTISAIYLGRNINTMCFISMQFSPAVTIIINLIIHSYCHLTHGHWVVQRTFKFKSAMKVGEWLWNFVSKDKNHNRKKYIWRYISMYMDIQAQGLKENEIPSHSVLPRKKKIGWLQGVSGKGKKVHPRTGHEGLDREQRYSSSLSLILALDWGGWSMPRPCWFTQERNMVPIVRSLRVDMKHKRNRINHKKEYEQFL